MYHLCRSHERCRVFWRKATLSLRCRLALKCLYRFAVSGIYPTPNSITIAGLVRLVASWCKASLKVGRFCVYNGMRPVLPPRSGEDSFSSFRIPPPHSFRGAGATRKSIPQSSVGIFLFLCEQDYCNDTSKNDSIPTKDSKWFSANIRQEFFDNKERNNKSNHCSQ